MGKWVIGFRLKRGGSGEEFEMRVEPLRIVLVGAGGIDDLGDNRPAASERSGFINGDEVDARGPLEVRTAFDQDTVPGRATDGGKNSGRGADDQGAR